MRCSGAHEKKCARPASDRAGEATRSVRTETTHRTTCTRPAGPTRPPGNPRPRVAAQRVDWGQAASSWALVSSTKRMTSGSRLTSSSRPPCPHPCAHRTSGALSTARQGCGRQRRGGHHPPPRTAAPQGKALRGSGRVRASDECCVAAPRCVRSRASTCRPVGRSRTLSPFARVCRFMPRGRGCPTPPGPAKGRCPLRSRPSWSGHSKGRARSALRSTKFRC